MVNYLLKVSSKSKITLPNERGNMNIKIKTLANEITLIKIKEKYLDSNNSQDFILKIGELIITKPQKIIVDLSQIEYISSTGIGTFIFFREEISKIKGKIILLKTKKTIYEVFKLVGMTEIYTFVEDLKSAKNLLQSAT